MRSMWIKSSSVVALLGLVGPATARQEDAARKAVVEKLDTLKAELPDVFFSGSFEGGSPGQGVSFNQARGLFQPGGQVATVNYGDWVLEVAGTGRTPEGLALGISAGAVAEPVRAQLKLPADRGVMLNAVYPGGPALGVGLRANDILLTLDGQPIASEADLVARLAALGTKAAPLAILRAGKPLAITVGGRSLATFAPAETPKVPDYYVGLETRPVDDALRAHLPSLPTGVGLLVEAPTPDGPAARAGVKPNDILLKAGQTPLPDVDALRAAIKAVGGKPLSFTLLRGGAESVVAVTPEVRKSTDPWLGQVTAHIDQMVLWQQKLDSAPVRLLTNVAGTEQAYAATLAKVNGTPPGTAEVNWAQPYPGTVFLGNAPPPAGLDKRLDALDAELKALRAAIDELRKAGAGK